MQYSPYTNERVAVATGTNFGLIGTGRLYILNHRPGRNGDYVERVYDTSDTLFSLAWSESNPSLVVASSGSGTVMLFDTNLVSGGNRYVKLWKEHQREVLSVNWNPLSRDCFVTGSMDGCIKIWDPNSDVSLCSFGVAGPNGANDCVNQVKFSPRLANCFVSCSNSRLQLFDKSSMRPILDLHRSAVADPKESFLTADFHKYNDFLIVSGSSSGLLRLHDTRFPSREIFTIHSGHTLGIRSVQFSPFIPDLVLSGGYDMSVRLNDLTAMLSNEGPSNVSTEIYANEQHSEFVTGVEFSLHDRSEFLSCSWDETVLVHKF